MPMIERRKITITLKGPYLTRSNSIGAFGVDAPVARLPDGTPYLPGTLILGRISEAFRQLAEIEVDAGETGFVNDLIEFLATDPELGKLGDVTKGRDNRRRVWFSDFVAQDEAKRQGTRTRIAINDATGSVLTGALQVIEVPYQPGESVRFSGEVRCVGPADRIETFLERLKQAFNWVTQWGALKTVGFGEAVSVAFSDVEAVPKAAAASSAAGFDTLRLVLELHDPLCVGERRIAENIYESAAVIPGGVIRGALANQVLAHTSNTSMSFLQDHADSEDPIVGPLARSMSKLRFGHGFPIDREKAANPFKPSRVPHSIVADDKNGLHDLALLPDPSVPILISGRATSFSVDWKSAVEDRANGLVGWSEPGFDFRVRTEIDGRTRASRAERLFAISYRRPDTHVWVSEVSLADVPSNERLLVAEAFEKTLANGLAGIGRGGAFATVSVQRSTTTSAALKLHDGGRVVLVLQTPALLRKPKPGQSGDVTKSYEEALRDCLPSDIDRGSLRVAGVFVRERLSGAEFMVQRRGSGGAYQPYLITEPGSVFVLEIQDNAKDAVAGWLRTGLPLPKTTRDFYGLGNPSEIWKHCPYVPENGYGEVSCATIGSPDSEYTGADIHEVLKPEQFEVFGGMVALTEVAA
jgi:hypothetical protein